jgi:hypothetical protein
MITRIRKIEEFLQILSRTWIIGSQIYLKKKDLSSLIGHINQHLEHGIRFSLNHFTSDTQ